MASLPRETAQDVRELVEKVTGLQEGKQFEQCYDYAISNLFHHKFFDVNSHNILRRVDGFRDKFYIHGQSEKSRLFYAWCQDILNSSSYEDSEMVDVPYSILSFLFELSNRPATIDYIPPPVKVVKIKNEKNDRSAMHLGTVVEQLDSCFQTGRISPISDLSDWSDDDEVEPPMESVKTETTVNTTSANECRKGVVVYTPAVNVPKEKKTGSRDAIFETGLSGTDWLRKNLEGSSRGQMRYADGGESNDYEQLFLENSDGSSLLISERLLVKELLWMLEGRKGGHVLEFNDKDQTFTVNRKIRMSHLSQESLAGLLRPLTNNGATVQMLKQFVKEVLEVDVPLHTVCQTYQAYASSVSTALGLFMKCLAKLEKLLIEQKTTFTLLILFEKLEAWTGKVDVLAMLHRKGVQSCPPGWTSAARAAHLLNTLYTTTQEYELRGDSVRNQMELVLSIFSQTVRPYLEIIDVWITECSLNDPCQEFIIACNPHAKTLDETFWANAIVLREIPWVKHGSMDTSAVGFLQPVLRMLVLVGRTVEVLRHLGALGKIVKHDFQPLFSFVKAAITDNGKDDAQLDSSRSDKTFPWKRKPLGSSGFERYLECSDMYDPILTPYFKKRYFKAPAAQITSSSPLDVAGESNSSEKSRTKLIGAVLEDALLSDVTGKFEHVCRSLLNLLNEEHQLKESLIAFRRYFLMEAGDVMFQFSSQMFDRIPSHAVARKQTELNLLLEDALSIFFPQDIQNLFVDVDKTVAKECKNAIDAYDCVRLVYQISWPLTLIINSSCKQRYDLVFNFLTKVKYAKYRLDELSFRDLRRAPKTLGVPEWEKKVKKMYICRMKLLHFVNGLHYYMLTHALQDTEALCEEIYTKGSDLERIASTNEDYMNRICERCLLHPSVTGIQSVVLKILGLALDFHRLWRNANSTSWEDINSVERSLDCGCNSIESLVQFLSLNEPVPHLETLVSSCCPKKQHGTTPSDVTGF